MELSTKMLLLAMGGARLAAADITKPNRDSLVQIDQTFEITWDTEGLTAPLTIDLIPADSTNGSAIAQRIAGQFDHDLPYERVKMMLTKRHYRQHREHWFIRLETRPVD